MPNVGFIDGQEVIKYPDYDSLVASWPASITRTELGLNQGATGPGTKMVYLMTAGNPSKPAVYIDGGIHGAHEWHAPVCIPRFLEHLLNPSGSAAATLALLAEELFWVVIPCVNPHAYSQSWTLNARNVNLNRNYDFHWAEFDDSGAVGSKGSAPFSEVETQYVRDTVLAHEPVAALTWHTWGGFDEANAASIQSSQMTFWQGVNSTLRQSAGLQYNLEPAGTDPTGANWLASRTGSTGRPTIACTPEPGSLFESEVIDAYHQNFMLAFGLQALNYARTGSQRIFPKFVGRRQPVMAFPFR